MRTYFIPCHDCFKTTDLRQPICLGLPPEIAQNPIIYRSMIFQGLRFNPHTYHCHCYRWNGSAHVILVDDNMFYHSMRYEYVQLARKCK